MIQKNKQPLKFLPKRGLEISIIILFFNINILKAETLNNFLSLEDSIKKALENNPKIKISAYENKAALYRIGQARAAYLPQIDLSADYSKKNTSIQNANTFNPDNNFNSYNSSASLNQLIFDFWKTPLYIKIQRLKYDSYTANLQNTINDVVYEVKQAYFEVLLALEENKVLKETINQYEQQLAQAEAFYKVGTKAKIFVTSAQVNLSNAKLDLIKSENRINQAIADLNNAMGLTDSPEYKLTDELKFYEYKVNFDKILNIAYENRPDLKALLYENQAAKENISYLKRNYFPELNASMNYGYSGREFPVDENWSIGTNLKFNLFDGFSREYKIKEAKADFEKSKSTIIESKQNIYLELKQAYLNFVEMREKIPVSKLTLEQAKENYDIAKGRYEVGVGNPIEVKDAELSYRNAAFTYIETLRDYNLSIAELEKYKGGFLINHHE